VALCTAPASTPWFHPPQVVWNHPNIGSTTVVLGGESYAAVVNRAFREYFAGKST
jgi:hypothetical protein